MLVTRTAALSLSVVALAACGHMLGRGKPEPPPQSVHEELLKAEF